MALISKIDKQNIINDFKISSNDTGSIEVQIALLTERINHLTTHFKANAKDYSSKRGLLAMVSRRRTFLKYIEKHNKAKYTELLGRLSLRK